MKKFLIGLMLFISTAAMASEYECKYDGSQREMNECAIRDYKIADDALNVAYAKKLKKLTVKQQQALRAEQRTWVRRRDARCLSKKNGEGTNVTIDYLTCLQSYTEIRTLQLH